MRNGEPGPRARAGNGGTACRSLKGCSGHRSCGGESVRKRVCRRGQAHSGRWKARPSMYLWKEEEE